MPTDNPLVLTKAVVSHQDKDEGSDEDGLGGGSGGETYEDTVELVDVRCEILSMGQQFQNLMNAIDVEELGLEGKDMPYGMADKKRLL